MLISYGGQKAEWKGTIVKEDGVEVIKNPNEPLYGEITFVLEEDLVIGNETDENYMFYRDVRIAVDSPGNIFALDSRNRRIQKYDKNGNYLQTIGRRGQGPGEFLRPDSVCLDSEENIYVQDTRKITVFNKNGTFKRTIPKSDFLSSWGVTKEGNFLARTSWWDPESNHANGTNEMILLDSEGKKIKTIVRYPFENPPPIKGKMHISNLFEGHLYSCKMSEQFWIYGDPSEYKLFLIDSSGLLVRVIQKDEPGESFTRKEKDKVVDFWYERLNNFGRRRGEKYPKGDIRRYIKFPKHKPYFSWIFSDDKERIYVGRFKSPLDENEITDYDVFNRDGYYLYKLKQSVPHQFEGTIKKGCLYRVERDEETDYLRIKRLKIKNWD